MTNAKIYSATLGTRERLVTYAVGFGVGVGVPLVLGVSFGLGFSNPFFFLMPAPFALVVLLLSLLRPVEFSLDGRSLNIHRHIGARSISLKGLRTIHHPATRPPSTNIGLVASHGFFGVFGLFWNKEWGRYHVFVTDSRNQVELVWEDGQRLILSPDNPVDFIATARKVVAALSG